MPPLTGGESLERPGGNERRPRPRIESLADLIFGLSLAIDSIALLPTSATKPGDMNSRILILAFFAHIISVEENRMVAPDLAKLFRSGRNRMAVLAALMAISFAPPFGQWTLLSVQVRILLWTAPLISYWLGRALRPQSRTYKLS